MFWEYLQSDLVLFGQFANKDIKCKHPYSFKQGELVVHQTIPRVDESSFLKLFKRDESDSNEDYYDDDSEDSIDRLYMNNLLPPGNSYEQGYMVYDNQDQNQLPPFNEIDSPLGHQMQGVNIKAQLIPQQLAQILAARQISHSKGHIFPFPSQKKQQEQEDDDESWITQQQYQQQQINQQLEEASGNFATEDPS